MNLWLDTASQEKIDASIKKPVDLHLLKQHLPGDFIENLSLYTQGNELYCMGLSDYPVYYDKLTPGDELLLTVTGENIFKYYAQVTGKTKNKDLVSALWPFQKATNIVYVYFITNIQIVNINKKEIFTELGLKRKTLTEALLVNKYSYERYHKIYIRLKLDIKEYNFPLSLVYLKENSDTLNLEMPIKEGDIILSLGTAPISKIIVWIQNIIAFFQGRKSTEFSHVSLGVADGVAIEATVVESNSVRFISYDELLIDRSQKFKIYRKTTSDLNIIKAAKSHVGREYTNLKISFFHGLLEMYFSKYSKESEELDIFCSSLVTRVLRESNNIEIDPKKKSHLFLPADLDRYIYDHSQWEDITTISKEILQSTKKKKYYKDLTSSTIKDFTEYSELESIDNQIKEWNNNYPYPNEIPLWEQLKILTRVTDKSYRSYAAQKKYTDFLNKRNSR